MVLMNFLGIEIEWYYNFFKELIVTNMRRGFTLIELVFVIVIISILAVIAIPRLMGTRDDAKVSSIISNTRTALSDFDSYYTSQGNANWKTKKIIEATNIPFQASDCTLLDLNATDISPTSFYLCDEVTVTGGISGVPCIVFTTIDEGNVTIAAGSGTTSICTQAQSDKAVRAMMKVHQLGGKLVVR